MAIFGSKKNTEKKVTAEAKVVKTSAKKPRATKAKAAAVSTEAKTPSSYVHGDFNGVIIGPRITEKATLVSEKGLAYVFNVQKGATKDSVAKAIADLYKVTPRQVRMANIPEKQVFSRGKMGVKKGGKKAYVYLKAGEKIEIV